MQRKWGKKYGNKISRLAKQGGVLTGGKMVIVDTANHMCHVACGWRQTGAGTLHCSASFYCTNAKTGNGVKNALRDVTFNRNAFYFSAILLVNATNFLKH